LSARNVGARVVFVSGAVEPRHLAWSCAGGPCAWLVWIARSNVFARLAQCCHVPNQHLDWEECLHATTGRSRVRRRRLGGSGSRGRPRAAAVSHARALRERGRRRASWPGCIPCRKLGPHFDCSYAHSPSVAGALELTPCMAASGRCGAVARSRLNARSSTRTGVGSVAWHATGRLQGGASPGDTARLPDLTAGGWLEGGPSRGAQGAVPRHAWACAHAYIGVVSIACIERGVSLLERSQRGRPRCLR
jgi:hypothetical protein